MQLFKITILIFLIIAIITLGITAILLIINRGERRVIGIYCFLSFLITLSFSCLYFLVLRLYQ